MKTYLIRFSTFFMLTGIFVAGPLSAQSFKECVYGAGKWSVSASGAYAPASFNEDLKITTTLADVRTGPVQVITGSTDITQPNLIRRGKSYKFNDHYDHPFRAGFEIGYFFRNFTEIFCGLDYYSLSGKKFSLCDITLNGNRIAVDAKLKAHNRLGMFVGARHFFDVCSWYYPYLGVKVGAVVHTKNGKNSFEEINCTILNGAKIEGRSAYQLTGARSITGLYGGLQAGIDVPLGCLHACLMSSSLFLGIEAVGQGAVEYDLPVRRVNNTNGGFQLMHEVTQAPRTFMSFPFTAGLKVRF